MQQNKQTVSWGIKSVPELLTDLALCCHCSTNFCQSFHLLPGLLLQLRSFCRCRESPPAQSPLCKPCFAHDSCMNKNPISQFTLLEGILQESKKSAMTQVFSLHHDDGIHKVCRNLDSAEILHQEEQKRWWWRSSATSFLFLKEKAKSRAKAFFSTWNCKLLPPQKQGLLFPGDPCSKKRETGDG